MPFLSARTQITFITGKLSVQLAARTGERGDKKPKKKRPPRAKKSRNADVLGERALSVEIVNFSGRRMCKKKFSRGGGDAGKPSVTRGERNYTRRKKFTRSHKSPTLLCKMWETMRRHG